MYAIITLRREDNQHFFLDLCDSRDLTLAKFTQMINDMYYMSETKFLVPQVEDITKLRAHKCLWERKNHHEFIWIILVENNNLKFEVDDHFLNSFKDGCVSYENTELYREN